MKALSLSSRFHHRSIRTIFLLLIVSLAFYLPASSISSAKASYSNHRIIVPMLMMEHRNGQPVLLGLYPMHWTGDQNVLNQEYHDVDNWSGKQMSLVGDFIDMEEPSPEVNVYRRYTLIWDNGYTPFINLSSTHTTDFISSGQADSYIRNWALSFKEYANGGRRMAYIAPLQEMNGHWVVYHQGPDSFKRAYQHIRSIFTSVGVPSQSVQWVFAPNGSSNVGDEFERYYPGDNEVDAVGFSAYNFGFCPDITSPQWIKPEKLFPPYINRMRIMAPGKPIFIAQTATTAMTKYGWNDEAKNTWIKNAYTLLANEGIRGIVYFNYDSYSSKGLCDLAFYKTWDQNQRRYSGYVEAIDQSAFRYQKPLELLSLSANP
ncbi:MAG: glycoside hydrolase family 26 protein [Omnitrophica WOR_2 bacterium]